MVVFKRKSENNQAIYCLKSHSPSSTTAAQLIQLLTDQSGGQKTERNTLRFFQGKLAGSQG